MVTRTSGPPRSGFRTHVDITVRGDVPGEVAEDARIKVADLAEHQNEPVPFAGVKLTCTPGSDARRPALAQAMLDVNGRPVRAHVAAATPQAAVEALLRRLREQLDRVSESRGAVGSARAALRAPRSRDGRPEFVSRPIAERQIVRHRSHALVPETPAEAVYEMEVMDYDFHLFVDSRTGRDSLVYRGGDGYFLAQAGPTPSGTPDLPTDLPTDLTPDLPTDVPLTVSTNPAAEMSQAQARARLEALGAPFVFFLSADTGRGCVLYRRFDGHYGLLAAAREEPA